MSYQRSPSMTAINNNEDEISEQAYCRCYTRILYYIFVIILLIFIGLYKVLTFKSSKMSYTPHQNDTYNPFIHLSKQPLNF